MFPASRPPLAPEPGIRPKPVPRLPPGSHHSLITCHTFQITHIILTLFQITHIISSWTLALWTRPWAARGWCPSWVMTATGWPGAPGSPRPGTSGTTTMMTRTTTGRASPLCLLYLVNVVIQVFCTSVFYFLHLFTDDNINIPLLRPPPWLCMHVCPWCCDQATSFLCWKNVIYI